MRPAEDMDGAEQGQAAVCALRQMWLYRSSNVEIDEPIY